MRTKLLNQRWNRDVQNRETALDWRSPSNWTHIFWNWKWNHHNRYNNKWRREEEKRLDGDDDYNRKSVNATVVRSPCGYVKYSPVLITLDRLWFDWKWCCLVCTSNELNIKQHTEQPKAPFCMMCLAFFHSLRFLWHRQKLQIKYTIHRPLNWTVRIALHLYGMMNANVFASKKIAHSLLTHHTQHTK